ncbi:MAG: CinA family protein [Gemmatimonadales bacterium]|nr:MAG: CinA family protein [Gemmatimonadales bacterium]
MIESVADLVPLADQVCTALRQRGETLSAAESCTGGWLAHEITGISGASDVFWGGIVTYADAAKSELADVPLELIRAHGAVSAEVAEALAVGIRGRSGTDWSVSITGIAGPTGGSSEKPVGTVWIATVGPSGTSTRSIVAAGSRAEVRAEAVGCALDLLLVGMEVEGCAGGAS